jgi:predicted aldo/keto reductase-like oxidoreductase
MGNEFQKGMLGNTQLSVGRLGVAASYGAPAEAFEEAFEKGCNYFYLGSGRRRANMKKAIRNICAKGQRDKLIVSIHTYARFGILKEYLFKRTLRSMNIEHADILILGAHNWRPSKMLLDRALEMKEKGLFRFLGMSGHNRTFFPKIAEEGLFDLFHIRYNAAHRGAETESFPYLKGESRPGIVTYTATRWAQLLKPEKMPAGESPLKSSDCYRFVLSNPSVDVCLCGPKDVEQMRAGISALELGALEAEEMARVKRIGDHVHQTVKGFF